MHLNLATIIFLQSDHLHYEKLRIVLWWWADEIFGNFRPVTPDRMSESPTSVGSISLLGGDGKD